MRVVVQEAGSFVTWQGGELRIRGVVEVVVVVPLLILHDHIFFFSSL